jgi:hypothetical protein
MMRKYIGLVAFCLAATSLHAGELPALAGQSIDIGGFHGVVYYTSDHDGYRVITTIAQGEAGLPVRFSATLAENQSVTISVPGKSGEPSQALEISRVGDKLILAKAERGAEETYNGRAHAMAE